MAATHPERIAAMQVIDMRNVRDDIDRVRRGDSEAMTPAQVAEVCALAQEITSLAADVIENVCRDTDTDPAEHMVVSQ